MYMMVINNLYKFVISYEGYKKLQRSIHFPINSTGTQSEKLLSWKMFSMIVLCIFNISSATINKIYYYRQFLLNSFTIPLIINEHIYWNFIIFRKNNIFFSQNMEIFLLEEIKKKIDLRTTFCLAFRINIFFYHYTNKFPFYVYLTASPILFQKKGC